MLDDSFRNVVMCLGRAIAEWIRMLCLNTGDHFDRFGTGQNRLSNLHGILLVSFMCNTYLTRSGGSSVGKTLDTKP